MSQLLYIDSDSNNCRLFTSNLTKQGFLVDTAETSQNGIDLALEKKPKIIFIEIDMPGMSGVEIVQVLKDNDLTKDIPVYLVGEDGGEHVVQLTMDAGCENYIKKPINFTALVPKIEFQIKSDDSLAKILIDDDDEEFENLVSMIAEANYDNPVINKEDHVPGDGNVIHVSLSEFSVDNNASENQIMMSLQDAMGNRAVSPTHSDYKKVKLSRLKTVQVDNVNVYLKLSDEKYVKFLSDEDSFDLNKCLEYEKKGTEYVYMDESSFNKLLTHSLKSIISKLKDSNLDSDEVVALQFESVEEIRNVVLAMGVKEEVIEAADEMVGSIQNVLSKDKSLKKVLDRLLSRMDYVAAHTHFMNYIFAAVHWEIPGANDKTIQKLIHCALFCDIAFDDKDLAMIQPDDEEKFNDLEIENQKEILDHINKSLKFLKKSNKFGDEEFKIIEMHHERPFGKGFPKKLSGARIPVLVCYFITGYVFTHKILTCKSKEDIDGVRILEEMREDFADGPFEKALETILQQLQ